MSKSPKDSENLGTNGEEESEPSLEPVSLEGKIDRLMGLVRVVADDQVTIRSQLAVIEADLAALSTRFDAFVAEQLAQKIRKLTPLPTPRLVEDDEDKEGA